MLQTLRNTGKHYATLANTTQHYIPQSLNDERIPTFKVETHPIENVLLLQSLVGNSFKDFCFWFSLLF